MNTPVQFDAVPPGDPAPVGRGRRRRWGIAAALAAAFGAVVATAVGGVLLLGIGAGAANTRDLLADTSILVVGAVADRIRAHLLPARAQAEYLAARMASGDIDTGNRERLVAALRDSLAAGRHLAGVFYLGPDYLGVDVHNDGRTQVEIDGRSNRAIIAVWEAAEQAPRGYWGNTVYNADRGDWLVNFRMPVRVDGRTTGLVATAVGTRALSDYLRAMDDTANATPFVLVGRDKVLAHPDLDPFESVDEAPALPGLDSIGDPVLARMWTAERSGRPGRLVAARAPGVEAHAIEVDGEEHLFVYRRLEGVGTVPWLIGVHIPEAMVSEFIGRIQIAIVVGIAVLLAAILAVAYVGRRISLPIVAFARAADLVRTAGPSAPPRLPGSRIREFDAAAGAFNQMVTGLLERETLHDLFGKYVPGSVVEDLLADRGVLEPQTRITTTLFTDIVGFSTVSETMTPAALIAMLNEYFEAIAEPIEANGGVIHQFQGDAILATFNLPVASPDHAERAVEAALGIQRATLDRRFAGDVALVTRVGINTGLAVCGTVGSGKRLGFTVHGDEVNLAARIEQLNKRLGTLVLISESTRRLLPDDGRFTDIGEFPVRGRRGGVVLYRVAGPHTPYEKLRDISSENTQETA